MPFYGLQVNDAALAAWMYPADLAGTIQELESQALDLLIADGTQTRPVKDVLPMMNDGTTQALRRLSAQLDNK